MALVVRSNPEMKERTLDPLRWGLVPSWATDLTVGSKMINARAEGLSDRAMTLADVDRLVHHATIFEMNVESYRRRTALERKRGPGRPPTRATITTTS